MRVINRSLSTRFSLLLMLLMLSNRASAQTVPLLSAATEPEAERFSFVVHGDLTGGERSGIFAVAAEQIRMLQPDFVISVGDLIEGDGVDAPALNAEWDAYEERAEGIGRPVYLVGGNHDLTSELQRQVWRDRYGSTYYHFVHEGALFLVLDTEDYTPKRRAEIDRARNEAGVVVAEKGWDAFPETEYARMPERETGRVGPEQRDYFLKVIEDNADVRWTFLLMHKAPWESEQNDGFGQIESALAGRPYTVFHGHVHAQRQEQRQGSQYVRLATTGGVQLPDGGRSVDHLTLVTLGDDLSIATLDLYGIRDPAGNLPGEGAALCFDLMRCDKD